MFMEEMTRKQPDVDKVTKTYKRKPAEAPSSLAERRGARESPFSGFYWTNMIVLGRECVYVCYSFVIKLFMSALCRQTPTAAAGSHAGLWGKPSTQPAVWQVAAGLATGSWPSAQAQWCSGQTGGGILSLWYFIDGSWSNGLSLSSQLKEFANFDFDVWRKKYMRWMNHKKSRVMDFFRRIDKDQDGKITRQEFIDGILASSRHWLMCLVSSNMDITDLI